MPLPENQTPWPPPKHAVALGDMAEWSAWYAGDTDSLRSLYQGKQRPVARVRPSQYAGGVVGRTARWWWGTPPVNGEANAKLHVPLAADLCTTSSDLLFSESVGLTSASDSLLAALDELQDDGLDAKLSEAAEVASALGGAYLRVVWDTDLSPMPWTNVVHADMALPTFRWDRLAEVTFWTKLPAHGADHVVWRKLEHHSPGFIEYALFRGKADNLGRRVPLEAHPSTEGLAKLGADGLVETGTKRLTATYVPNMLPNRMHRESRQGRSDLQGLEPLLDSLDEAYSSWWRDIRHGKSRIHVPEQYLEDLGPGNGAGVNLDRELYVPVSGVLRTGKDGMLIDAQQFKIRVAEHKETCAEWTKTIIESAGYSTQSLTSDGGGAVTAAEVHSHERRSYTTRGKKIRYWRLAIRDHIEALVEVANANMSAGIREDDVKVEFRDGVQDSVATVAQTLQALRNAEAASTEVRVRMLHPDWTDRQVSTEVAKIMRESSGSAEPLPIPEDAGL